MTICHICNEYPAKGRCSKCGRPVCSRHAAGNGLCIICNEALCRICRSELSITHCISCGRLGCHKCLIQLDNVRRVCIECVRRGNIIEVLEERRKGIWKYASGARRLTENIIQLRAKRED